MPSIETPRVAIIGAGFAGSITAAQLLRQASAPLEVLLIERRYPFGAGRAFTTSLPCHLLNVPAGRMSAFPDDPEHLLRWLSARSNAPGQGYAFIPRLTYGAYVEDTLRQAADVSAARLTRIEGEATRIEEGEREQLGIHLRDGAREDVSHAVLALGNPQPLDPLAGRATLSRARYAPDPWDEGALEALDPRETVVTIGSNLTMVDVALGLDYRNHRGPIIAVSTHGLMPQPHAEQPVPAWTSLQNGNVTGPRSLLRALRAEMRTAATSGIEWRSVVDALRPRTRSIWSAWPERERRRFLRHARPYWEIHRHRMAPENASTIARLQRSGQLRVLAGRIVSIAESGDRLEISLQPRGASRLETIPAASVVNCTGPGVDFRLSRDPLVMDLFARGRARPGPLGMGFGTDSHGALLDAEDRPSRSLFTLGTPLKGMYWETTAVPEIRVQAQALAQRLLTP